MKKYLFLVIIFFTFYEKTLAINVVYPKTNPVKINASSTFFIGSIPRGGSLKINDIDVKISPIGAFAQIVPLNYGNNNFVLVSDSGRLSFNIERAQPAAAPAYTRIQAFVEYPIMTNFYVATDNTVLRATPIDSGINRISHLPKDMQVFVNGEKNGFYRVYLNSKLNGWILKSNVEQRDVENCPTILANLNEFKIKNENEFCEYEFYLSKKVPFTLSEENGLTLQLFNIEGQEDNTLILNVPFKKLIGYDAYFDEDKFILKVRKMPKISTENPLHSIKIAVDAGHGGSEFGAIGGCGDKEKDINLAIAKNLHKELENRGAKVIMIREDDVNVSLADRVKIAKEKDSTILISIHANALPDGADPIKNRGTSVYYYHNQAKPLADNILNSMTTRLGTNNDRVRQGSLALVRPTSSVSVLIEVAYIINPDDYSLLLDKDFQLNCAKAIADGIEKYFLN